MGLIDWLMPAANGRIEYDRQRARGAEAAMRAGTYKNASDIAARARTNGYVRVAPPAEQLRAISSLQSPPQNAGAIERVVVKAAAPAIKTARELQYGSTERALKELEDLK